MRLVPFHASHFGRLADWFDSESATVQWGGPAVTHPVDDAQLDGMLQEGRSDSPARLCWMAQECDILVGHVQVAFDWRNGNALIGRVAIDPSSRGRGFAVPMLALAIQEAFRPPDIRRVELNVYSFNTAALRTYERAGFRTEGIRRSSARVGAERWDAVMMAILREEWTGASDSHRR